MATYKIKPNTAEGKEQEQAALMRSSRADTLLTEIDADITNLSSVADQNARQILRHILQTQKRILRALAKG